jgi:protein AATF/BFR2
MSSALPASGRTLAQQLKQLQSDEADSHTPDVDSAYSSLEPHALREVEREHYLDVGPSKLRKGAETAGLGKRYEGKTVGRMKIFDDDEDEDDVPETEEGEDEDSDEGVDEDEAEDTEEDEDENSEASEGDEEEEEEEEEEKEEEGEEEGGEDGEEAEPLTMIPPTRTIASRTLDPLNSLREARIKDIEKGKAIRHQKVSCLACPL